MKLNLKRPLLNLEGQAVKGPKLHELAASALATSGAGSGIKLLVLAIELQGKGEAEVDRQDLPLVKNVIDNCRSLTALVRGRILQAIEEQEKKKQ